MNRKILLTILFVLSILIVVLNNLAGEYFWYWKFWWFDILMHFLGGFTISLFVYYIYNIISVRRIKLVSAILFTIITIAVFWEVFEFIIGNSIYEKNYFLDTITDIFAAIVASLIAYRIIFKSNPLHLPEVTLGGDK